MFLNILGIVHPLVNLAASYFVWHLIWYCDQLGQIPSVLSRNTIKLKKTTTVAKISVNVNFTPPPLCVFFSYFRKNNLN